MSIMAPSAHSTGVGFLWLPFDLKQHTEIPGKEAKPKQ